MISQRKYWLNMCTPYQKVVSKFREARSIDQLRSAVMGAESVVAIETMKRDDKGSYHAAQCAYRYYFSWLKRGIVVADGEKKQNGNKCADEQCKGCYGKDTPKNTALTLF